MSANPFPQFIQDMIACPPRHGEGVHQWLYKLARHLHAHRDRETIIDLLAVASDGCGRPVPMSEIVAAVDSAKATAWQPNGNRAPVAKPAPKWPACDHKLREQVIADAGICVVDLWEASPMICTRDSMDAEFFADHLFPGNPLL